MKTVGHRQVVFKSVDIPAFRLGLKDRGYPAGQTWAVLSRVHLAGHKFSSQKPGWRLRIRDCFRQIHSHRSCEKRERSSFWLGGIEKMKESGRVGNVAGNINKTMRIRDRIKELRRVKARDLLPNP